MFIPGNCGSMPLPGNLHGQEQRTGLKPEVLSAFVLKQGQNRIPRRQIQCLRCGIDSENGILFDLKCCLRQLIQQFLNRFLIVHAHPPDLLSLRRILEIFHIGFRQNPTLCILPQFGKNSKENHAKEKNMSKSIHTEHRQRVKKRFLR